MKIILLEDVKKLGHKGEIVDVSDGYARNFIIPKKLGVEATQAHMAQLQTQLDKMKRDEELRIEEAKKVAKELEGKQITLFIKAGENGRTFGSVTSKEIADEIKNAFNYEIDKKKIDLEEAIKAVGKYEVVLKIYKDVLTKILVEVKNV